MTTGSSIISTLLQGIAQVDEQKTSQQSSVEVEMRFIVPGRPRDDPVSVRQYRNLLTYLHKMSQTIEGKASPPYKYLGRRTIIDQNKNLSDFSTLRKSTEHGVTRYYRKTAVGARLDATNKLFMRLAINTEEPITQGEFDQATTVGGSEVAREKIRESFETVVKGFRWRIDVTEIKDKHEIEAEIVDYQALKTALLSPVNYLQVDESFVNLSTRVVKHMYSPRAIEAFWFEELKGVVDATHKHTWLVLARNLYERDIVGGGLVGGSITYDVRHKVDGIRQLMYISKKYGVWLIYPDNKDPMSGEYALIVKPPDEKQRHNVALITWFNMFDGLLLDGDWVSGWRSTVKSQVEESKGDVKSQVEEVKGPLTAKPVGPIYIPFDTLMVKGNPGIQVEDPNLRYQAYRPLLLSQTDRMIDPNPKEVQKAITIFGKDRLVFTTRDELAMHIRMLEGLMTGLEKNIRHLPYPVDGYVFTPLREGNGKPIPYIPLTPDGRRVQDIRDPDKRVLSVYPDVCRFKPLYTVDLYWQPNAPGMGLYASAGKDEKVSRRAFETNVSKIDLESLPKEAAEHDVFEIMWDSKTKKYKKYSERADKFTANYYQEAERLKRLMTDPSITIGTLLGKDMRIYRYYHNRIKQWLIQRAGAGAVMLDIGAGRGRDALKWQNVGIKHVYAVEPNEEYLSDLRTASESVSGSGTVVEVIPGRLQDTIGVLDSKVSQVDVISSMFTLGFFWPRRSPEGKATGVEDFKVLVDVVQRKLRPGGIMIVATMDGDAIMRVPVGPDTYRKIGASPILSPGRYFFDMDVGARTVVVELTDSSTVSTRQTESMVFIQDLVRGAGLEIVEWYYANAEKGLTMEEMTLSQNYGYGILRKPNPVADLQVKLFDSLPALPLITNLGLKHQVDRLWHEWV